MQAAKKAPSQIDYLQIVCVQNDGERTVVDQVDLHVGAKDTVRHVIDVLGDERQKVLVKFVSDIGRAGIRKRRTAAVAAVGKQRELRYHEYLTVDIGQCQIGLAVLVLVDTQPAELAPQFVGLRRVWRRGPRLAVPGSLVQCGPRTRRRPSRRR